MSLNPETIVGQMRLNTGDFIEGSQYLEDSIYLWLYEEHNRSVIDGSIAALESIINYLALSPQSWTLDNASETRQSLDSLESRLVSLRAKKRSNVPAMVIRTDRKDWDDFDKVFK